MVIAAWIFGALGLLSGIAGVLRATEILDFLNDLPAGFTPMLWLTIGVLLVLISIALAVSRTEYE